MSSFTKDREYKEYVPMALRKPDYATYATYATNATNAKEGKEIEEEKTIYLAPRDEEFRTLIRSLLVRGKLLPKYIDLLTTEKSMEEYSKAFTAESADKENNSEVYEQLGDVTANKFIVWYMYKRFPQLMCTEGVKVVARLRINYGAKQSFYNIANNLGFWKFISASDEDRSRKMKPLLEDSLEAFIGATEFLLDSNFRQGVGNGIVYDILANIFDEMPISLEYEDLYDAKTRLKELFDYYGAEIGKIEYKPTKMDMITKSVVYRVVGEGRHIQYIPLGEGTASLKADAEQNAAKNALAYLKSQGYSKPVPEVYSKFCKK